jgi:uncharacterized protein (DUF2384 family)
MPTYTTSSDIKEEYAHPEMIRNVASQYGLSLKVVCKIVGISTSAIYCKQRTLNKNTSEHLQRLEKLMRTTTEYFGCESSARQWFTHLHRGLACRPIEICNTLSGIQRVENSINKLNHGMTA